MREILFRGKRTDNGNWVQGVPWEALNGSGWYLFQVAEIAGAERMIHVKVDSATIGQYTGLTDKNGKKIFEGDIIKTHYANVSKADFIEEVVFHNGKFCALYQKDGGKMWCPLADGVPHHPADRAAYMEWCEIIGNIHDNPELMKGE